VSARPNVQTGVECVIQDGRGFVKSVAVGIEDVEGGLRGEGGASQKAEAEGGGTREVEDLSASGAALT
jgi:hypothetical protein